MGEKMESIQKCEFCGREFTSQKIVRVVRNSRHVFCSVGCFICWRYQRPSSQGHAFYNLHTVRVPGEQLNSVLAEILPDAGGTQNADLGQKGQTNDGA